MPYKIRRNKAGSSNKSGEPYIAASLTVPNRIADKIPADVLFEPEWHQDGIFFRQIGRSKGEETEIPAWAKEN